MGLFLSFISLIAVCVRNRGGIIRPSVDCDRHLFYLFQRQLYDHLDRCVGLLGEYLHDDLL